MVNKIYYGKNVYDHKEINAVLKTLKNTTQMGPSVSEFAKKVSKIFSKITSSPELETGINSDIPWIADKNKILIR